MKSLISLSLLLLLINSAYALESAEIYSIDDGVPPFAEEALDLYPEPTSYVDDPRFTPISDATANSLFATLTNDSRARMRVAGGACSTRRVYIQNYLKKKDILSGRLLIRCPANNGRLRLRDQVTGRYYTFSNFHDTNVVLVGSSYKVVDLQFESGPVSLENYLAEIRVYQRVEPGKEFDAGTCYWSIR